MRATALDMSNGFPHFSWRAGFIAGDAINAESYHETEILRRQIPSGAAR
jgi:hypothetical protein